VLKRQVFRQLLELVGDLLRGFFFTHCLGFFTGTSTHFSPSWWISFGWYFVLITLGLGSSGNGSGSHSSHFCLS
jgi:hypothetical protein